MSFVEMLRTLGRTLGYYRNRAALATFGLLVVFLPLSAQADECDSTYANFQAGDTKTKAMISAEINRIGGNLLKQETVEERVQHTCDLDNAFVDASRRRRDAVSAVVRACGTRVKFECDMACQQRDVAEQEKKAAYACSPAALNDARTEAAQKEKLKAQQNAQETAKNAIEADAIMGCAGLMAEDDFNLGLPVDAAQRAKDLKACNKSKVICEDTRKDLIAKNKPVEGLACDGT